MTLDLDIDALLSPIGDDEPCGANLEYDPDFLALEEALRVDPGQEFSNSDTGERITIEGAGVDWAAVRKLADALMLRTRDVRVGVSLTRALVRTEGFEGLAPGLKLIVGLLEQHWAHVHPQLDHEEDDDPTMRVNALYPLVASEALISDLRESWLARSRQLGVLTVRGVEVFQGKLAARQGEEALSEAQVRGLLDEALAENPALRKAVAEAAQHVNALSSLLQEQVGASHSIDFKPLQAIVHNVAQAVALVAPPAGDEADLVEAGDENGAVARNAVSKPGEIRSRSDVTAALDQLVQYLQRAEPTNPAQHLLLRAKKVLNMSFLETIQEFAPEALHQAELMLGSQLESSDG